MFKCSLKKTKKKVTQNRFKLKKTMAQLWHMLKKIEARLTLLIT